MATAGGIQMSAIAFRSRIACSIVLAAALAACTASKNDNVGPPPPAPPAPPAPPPVDPNKTAADKTFDDGQKIFRSDTFGDEAFWTNTIQLNKAIATVDPTTALSVGLKVDADALPASLVADIKAGKVDLKAPATTLALLDLDAVVGVKASSDGAGGIKSLGITCALCHSTVDNSFAPGIGKRLDGWPNRDLNVGAIVSLAPNLQPVATLLGVDVPTLKSVLTSWGPGKYDAEIFLDGNPTLHAPEVNSSATLIPPAYGLRGVNMHTYTGWGSITQWNAFVAVLEMHGQGSYTDTRLDNSAKFPVAAAPANHMGHTVPPAGQPDLVTSKLGALEFYELALEAPTPPAGSFDAAAAKRGEALFTGAAKCATCHVAPLYTDAGWNMHDGAEIGIDNIQANRSPDGKYRTTPLHGLFAHDAMTTNPAAKGRYYHDGRFATLDDVVAHYNTAMSLALSPAEQSDLVQYLKSL
ncbi:MAG: hypothetical protein E6J61_10710 [Deltaproteobacteria bacterium]|nr:MAG: hypothetical protein E6J61_10710 [Deltaproteobacteria bacterium]